MMDLPVKPKRPRPKTIRQLVIDLDRILRPWNTSKKRETSHLWGIMGGPNLFIVECTMSHLKLVGTWRNTMKLLGSDGSTYYSGYRIPLEAAIIVLSMSGEDVNRKIWELQNNHWKLYA
jgi:hypothetical protein